MPRAAESGTVSTDTNILSGQREEWAAAQAGTCEIGRVCWKQLKGQSCLAAALHLCKFIQRTPSRRVYNDNGALFFKVLFSSSKCCFEKKCQGI